MQGPDDPTTPGAGGSPPPRPDDAPAPGGRRPDGRPSGPPGTPQPPSAPPATPATPQPPAAPPEPAPKKRSRLPIIILGLVVALALVAVAAGYLLSRGPSTYSGNGVTFEYPGSWGTARETSFTATTGNSLWSEGFGPGQEASLVIVTAYELQVDASDVSAEQIRTEIDAALDDLVAQAGGTRESELETAKLGSLDAFQTVITATGPGGEAVESRVVFAFDGRTEYFLNCQYEPDTETEILDGCDQIQSTFEVT